MSFDGGVWYSIAKYTTQSVRIVPGFEVLAWPEADDRGNIASDSGSGLVLKGTVKSVMVPGIDVGKGNHG